MTPRSVWDEKIGAKEEILREHRESVERLVKELQQWRGKMEEGVTALLQAMRGWEGGLAALVPSWRPAGQSSDFLRAVQTLQMCQAAMGRIEARKGEHQEAYRMEWEEAQRLVAEEERERLAHCDYMIQWTEDMMQWHRQGQPIDGPHKPSWLHGWTMTDQGWVREDAGTGDPKEK